MSGWQVTWTHRVSGDYFTGDVWPERSDAEDIAEALRESGWCLNVGIRRVEVRMSEANWGEVERLTAERDEWARRATEASAEAERLRAALDEYASHQSWRCDHPDRYPHEPDCPCGLVGVLRGLGHDSGIASPARNA
jgi:hypothetical protein